MTKLRFGTALALLAGTALCAGTASAQTSQACASNKEKALGKTAAAVLNCYSAAAKKGLAVDAGCLQKAKAKWTFPAKGAFEKAELKGGCALEGQQYVLEGRCSNDATKVCNSQLDCTSPGTCGGRDDATEAQGLYDLVLDENLSVLNPTSDGLADNVAPLLLPDPLAANGCQAAKLKATGKLGADLLGCHSKAAKKNLPVDPACISKATDKMTAAFGKAEAKGGCTTTNDAAAIQTNATSFIERAVGAIPRNDGCGSGIVLLPETCDDGNTIDTDSCPSDCIVATCTPNGGSDDPHTVSFTSTKGAVAALTVFVDYPEDKVSILGSGTSIPFGVIDGVIGDPFTASSFNDRDYGLTAALAEGTGADFGLNGDLFTVHYETCSGAGAAAAGDFTCTVLNAADATGKPLTGVTCSVD